MYLEHANITVANIESTLEFLATAFPEFYLRGEGKLSEQEGKWVHFGTETTYIALQENDDRRLGEHQRYYETGINHLGFVVDNLDEISERLSTKGYSSMDPAPHAMRRRRYFYDADGSEWEFVEYLSGDPKLRNQY